MSQDTQELDSLLGIGTPDTGGVDLSFLQGGSGLATGIDPLALAQEMVDEEELAYSQQEEELAREAGFELRDRTRDTWYEQIYAGFTEGDNVINNFSLFAEELLSGEEMTDEQKQKLAQMRDEALNTGWNTVGELMADIVGWGVALAAMPKVAAGTAIAGTVGALSKAKKAKTLLDKRKMAIYSAEGAATMAVDGALRRNVRGEEQTLEALLEDTVMGAGLGVGVSVITDVARGVVRKYTPKEEPIDITTEEGRKIAREIGTDIEAIGKKAKEIEETTNLNREAAIAKAAQERRVINDQLLDLGINPQTIQRIGEMTSKKFDKLQEKIKKRATRRGAAKVTGFAKETLDKWGGVMSTRISYLDREIGGRVRRADVEQLALKGMSDDHHRNLRKIKDTLDTKTVKAINKALFNNKGVTTVKEIIQQSKLGVEQKREFSKYLDEAWEFKEEMADELFKDAKKYKRIQNHWPRVYTGKDMEMREALKDAVDQQVIPVGRGTSAKKIASLNKRRRVIISEKDLDEYLDFDDAFGYMMEGASRSISKRRVFEVNGKLPRYGEAIRESVARLVRAEIEKGNTTPELSKELSSLLMARFDMGEKSPVEGIQWINAATQVTVMGQVESAIVQVGDIAVTAFNNGIRNALLGIRGVKNLGVKDVGIADHLVGELAEIAGKSRGLGRVTPHSMVQGLYKLTGLTRIDHMNKNINLRSSRRRLMNQLKTQEGTAKFFADHPGWSQQELIDMLPDLREGNITRDTKAIYASMLLDSQPVGLSETTEFLAANPNLRVWGTIKGFLIKQLDIQRRRVYDELVAGNKAEALRQLTRYTALMVTMNGTVSSLIEVLRGNEPQVSDEMVETFLRTYGSSTFLTDIAWENVEKKLEDDNQIGAAVGVAAYVGAWISEMILPVAASKTISLGEDLTRLGDPEGDYRLIRTFPVVGSLIERWFLGGLEREEEKRLEREFE